MFFSELDMLQQAQQKGDQFFISSASAGPKASFTFQSCASPQEFLAAYTQPAFGVCERYYGHQKGRLFFDIEQEFSHEPPRQQCKEMLDRVIGVVAEGVSKLMGRQCVVETVVVEGSRTMPAGTFKVSYHLFMRNVLFESLDLQRRFIEWLQLPPGTVDMSVYPQRENSGHNLRLVGSYKWDDPSRTALRIVPEWSAPNARIEDTLVTVCDYDATAENNWIFMSRSLLPSCDAAARPRTKERKRAGEREVPEDDSVLKHLQSLLPATHQHHRVVVGKEPGVYPLRNTGPRECLLTPGRTHDSNNAYLTLSSSGTVTYRCHSDHCKHLSLELTPRSVGVFRWADGISVHTHDPDAQHVLPYHLEGFQKCLIISASMGLGKTTRLREWIQQTNYKRVLLVSPRQAFGRTLRGLFPDFSIYHEPGAMTADKLICQYESLHKLDSGDLRTFDAVIIDEVRSVIRNMTCRETNGQHIAKNSQILQFLMQHAHATILLDADVEYDGAVQSLVTSLYSPPQITVHRYRRVALPRRMLRYINEERWQYDLMRDVEDGKKVVVCVATRKQGGSLYTRIRDRIGEAKVRFYHSKCDDSLLRDFADLDAAWRNIQVVIYTSKVTVGADYTGECDRIYMHADRRGVIPREMLQMMGRVRKPLDNVVRMFVAPQQEKGVVRLEYEEALTEFHERRKCIQKYADHYLYAFEASAEQGRLKWCPTWIAQLHAWNRREQVNAHRLWWYEFDDLCRLRQYEVTCFTDAPGSSMEPIMEPEQCDDGRKLFERVTAGGLCEDQVNEATDRKKRQMATTADKMMIDVFYVQKHFAQRQLTYEEFVALQHDAPKIFRVAAVMRAPDEKLIQRDQKHFQEVPWLDFADPVFPVLAKLNEMARVLGLENVLDTKTHFRPRAMQEHKETLERLSHEVSSLLKVRAKGQSMKSILSLLWRTAFGATVRTAKRKREKNEATYCIEFPKLFQDRTVLDYARESDYFSTDAQDPRMARDGRRDRLVC